MKVSTDIARTAIARLRAKKRVTGLLLILVVFGSAITHVMV